MSGNPFALLDVEVQEKKPVTKAPKAEKKAAVAPKKDAAAAPKKDAKAVPQQKKPLASGERDRHTKGGRSEGENTKRPFDRSLNRQTKGQTERKGQDKQVKGGWAAKNPEADQVAPDADQKKDEEIKKEEEVKVEEPVKEQKPEEPAPFLLQDALKSKQKVAGERTKIRAATAAADSKSINSGAKPTNTVAVTKKGAIQVSANKKAFNIDEFQVVTGGAAKTQYVAEERQYKKRPTKADFPSF